MSAGGRSQAEQKREQRLALVEDAIGRALAASEASGELRSAPSFGKPLAMGDGFDQTPAELRMPMKILKDAGVVPPEIVAMREIATLQLRCDTLAADDPERAALLRALADRRLVLALRLEKLRLSGSL